jgi:hypothetical protein
MHMGRYALFLVRDPSNCLQVIFSVPAPLLVAASIPRLSPLHYPSNPRPHKRTVPDQESRLRNLRIEHPSHNDFSSLQDMVVESGKWLEAWNHAITRDRCLICLSRLPDYVERLEEELMLS